MWCSARGVSMRAGQMTDGLVLQMPAHPGAPYRPPPIEKIKAAVIAIRAGRFDAAVAGGDPVPAETSAPIYGHVPSSLAELGTPTVVVVAGHAGAGASTVALALAEALSGRWQVQLVEYCDPRRSGLGAASCSELGVDEAGWRRGRRGSLELARLGTGYDLAQCIPPPQPLPAPRGAPAGDRLLVLDLGWTGTSMLGQSAWLPAVMGSAELVVVSRLTVPAVRQTEHVLTALGLPAVLATVGSGRWPGEVNASCGPALRAARDAGRAVMVPVDRRLEISGLTADPLPKPVAAAGKALAAQLSPDQPVLPGMCVTPEEGF